MKKRIISIGLLVGCLLLLLYFLFNSPQKNQEKLAQKGKQLYLENCSHCHGEKGEGFKKLYPPLTDTTVLSVSNIFCTIKYGKTGGSVIHGQEYLQPMPAMDFIENDEITAIINYIYNEINGMEKTVKLKDINAVMRDCY